MKKLIFSIFLVASVSVIGYAYYLGGMRAGHSATCTGSKNCNACKNCKYCGHCAKNGGSCGVCR